MNAPSLTTLTIATAVGLVAFPTAWSVAQNHPVELPAAPSGLTLSITSSEAPVQQDWRMMFANVVDPQVASAQWSDIKDVPYASRASFFTGLKRLQARVDQQVRELTAKRALMDGNAETQDWDFAMKEMENARAYLRSTGEEATTADVDNWEQKKEKVGLAWTRTQDAYSKVQLSTTS